jgi:hypothetical protein
VAAIELLVIRAGCARADRVQLDEPSVLIAANRGEASRDQQLGGSPRFERSTDVIPEVQTSVIPAATMSASTASSARQLP